MSNGSKRREYMRLMLADPLRCKVINRLMESAATPGHPSRCTHCPRFFVRTSEIPMLQPSKRPNTLHKLSLHTELQTHRRNIALQVSSSPLNLLQLGKNRLSNASLQTSSFHRPTSSLSRIHFGRARVNSSANTIPLSSGSRKESWGSLARVGG